MFVFSLRHTIGESGMDLAPVFLGTEPLAMLLPVSVYLIYIYIYILLSPFPSSFVFLSLCGDFVVLTLVFLSGFSSAAYMTAFLV